MPTILSFLAPYWGKIVLVLVILAVGFGAGVKYKQPMINKLNQQIGGYEETIHSMTALVDEQNTAIDKLKVEAQQRAAEAQKAVDEAKALAVEADKRAAEILASKPPKGKNQCLAAVEVFRAELKAERSRK